MNTETETLVAVINSRLKKMNAEDRIIIFEQITNGYCWHCGNEKEEGSYCHCNNDE